MNRISIIIVILSLPMGLLGQGSLPEAFLDLKQNISSIRDSIDQAVRARMTPLDHASWPYLQERIEWNVLKDYELLWVEFNEWASPEEHSNEVYDMRDKEVHRSYYRQLKKGVARMGKVRDNDTDPIWMAQVFDDRYIVVSSQSMHSTTTHYYSYYLVRK